MIRVTLCGAAGRMGGEIRRAIAAAPDLTLVLAVERPGHPQVGACLDDVPLTDALAGALTLGDVIVDFTAPEAAVAHAETAAQRGLGYVSGTTGLSAEQLESLHRAAERIPLLHANNMSLGIAVLCALLRQAGGLLPEADLEIVEMHHRRKKDAPSGTALRLAGVLQQARAELSPVHGRHGLVGERGAQELGIHALRGGDVVGEHHVIFAAAGERLVLSHIAESRGAFVSGALAGVRFVAERDPGFYTMEDVLGLAGR
jgi:4-hydroxy-tetrahydrodipicolinate reductase